MCLIDRFFSACWIPIKLLLRVSADLNWDGDLFLCIASCPLNICDQWDLQAGRLSVCVCAWPCGNFIWLEVFPFHRDAPGRSNCRDSRSLFECRNYNIQLAYMYLYICAQTHTHINRWLLCNKPEHYFSSWHLNVWKKSFSFYGCVSTPTAGCV